jgi:hypothetical protein
MAFELSAHMTVRPGQLDGFKKQAAELIRITREKDPYAALRLVHHGRRHGMRGAGGVHEPRRVDRA